MTLSIVTFNITTLSMTTLIFNTTSIWNKFGIMTVGKMTVRIQT
jgi:hypothetical protein